jgi:hypothetical protein
MDLSITPEQYKKLWWETLIDEMVKTQRCFTIPELQQFAEEKIGQSLSSNNFHRAVLKNAPVFDTGMQSQNPAGGRPATYYCSTKI